MGLVSDNPDRLGKMKVFAGMTRKNIYLILIFILTNALFGCAGKNSLVVLLTNPDGSVGNIVITNPKGTTILSQAGQASNLKSIKEPPSEAFTMDEGEIAAIFGSALNAQPQPPSHFILYFEHNSTKLSDEALALLNKIHEAIRERKSVDASIVGHTDTAGDKQYNFDLSKRRAIAVSKLLISRGVDPQILETTSHGEKNLLILTEDNVPEPKNRRVEVTVR